MIDPPPAEAGFTLIEVMVALAILAVASAGLIRALEGQVDAIRGMERRAVAQWAAENRLVEAGLPGGAMAGTNDVTMLGQSVRVRLTVASSADPDLRAVTVAAGPIGETPFVTLRGFADAGTITR